MRLFDSAIVDSLKPALVGGCIDSVLLGTYGMDIVAADVSLHCSELVLARINGVAYQFQNVPSAAPWGLLVRQTITDVEMAAPDRLRLRMESGDQLELHTVEGQYESVVIRYPSPSDQLVMDVY